METIKNAASWAMGSNTDTTQSGTEPVSGQTGRGTGTEPYDAGNTTTDSTLSGSAPQNTSSTSGLGKTAATGSSTVTGSAPQETAFNTSRTEAPVDKGVSITRSGDARPGSHRMDSEELHNIAAGSLRQTGVYDNSGLTGSSGHGHGHGHSHKHGAGASASAAGTFTSPLNPASESVSAPGISTSAPPAAEPVVTAGDQTGAAGAGLGDGTVPLKTKSERDSMSTITRPDEEGDKFHSAGTSNVTGSLNTTDTSDSRQKRRLSDRIKDKLHMH